MHKVNLEDSQEEPDINIIEQSPQVSFEQIIDTMLDDSTPIPTRYLYRLSDLNDKDLELLHQHWLNIPLWRRQALMEDLKLFAKRDLMLSYEAIGRLALNDTDPKVRIGAIETLMANECECLDLVDIYLERMEKDIDRDVRVAATGALGQFIYLAEMEVLNQETKKNLEDRLLSVAQNHADRELQRRSLESLGYSTREEISALIEAAFNAPDPNQQTSSLVAMGRSGNDRWKPQVLNMLTHSNPTIRTEAARAAGELGMAEARVHLFDLTEDANQNVCLTALWALSQIGGKGVRKILQERLQEADDDEEIAVLESALDNLDFSEGSHDISLIGDEEEDELYISSIEGEDVDEEDIFDIDDEDDDFFNDIEDDDIDDYLGDEEDDDFEFLDDDDDDVLWG